MRPIITFGALLLASMNCFAVAPTSSARNPGAQTAGSVTKRADWLVDGSPYAARATVSGDGKTIELSNGLVRRTIRITPDAATIGLDNLMRGESMLRAVNPEAVVTIDGTPHPVGGLLGQPDRAFLRPEWIGLLHADPSAFHFTGYSFSAIEPRFAWKRVRHSANLPWPPRGAGVTLHFTRAGERLQGITVDVHYEIYSGIPLLSKWLTLRNGSPITIRLNSFQSETLACVEYESAVGTQPYWHSPLIYAASDYAFGGDTPQNANHTTCWEPDPEYDSQVNYELKSPLLLVSRPPLGPDEDIAPGASLETFRTFELLYDGDDRERNGLAVRKMYRALAPWCTENPLMLHLTSIDPTIAHNAIDQCVDVGFEMVILSFGSGLNMEDASAANLKRFKDLADYAHSKGVQIGGYSLLASRHIDDQNDVINPKTGKSGDAIFGYSPCLTSDWGIQYFKNIRTFLNATGFDLLEHDGSYPGDVCASTTHPGHKGLGDSQWAQFQTISSFYKECRASGIYLNVPDWYFLSGSNKTGMGYRETNWSLPREQQIIHARQNMYDGTWLKTPSMGWMFVPLVEYQGGGAAATIEPLKDHLAQYEAHMANDLGYGVQACYRGPRLYDSAQTRTIVKKWVSFFKKHRSILESDIIHVRRADARDYDCILHVNPSLAERGLAMVYNPTHETITRTLDLPVYYTGLQTNASVSIHDRRAANYTVDRNYHIRVKVSIEPGSVTWLIIK